MAIKRLDGNGKALRLGIFALAQSVRRRRTPRASRTHVKLGSSPGALSAGPQGTRVAEPGPRVNDADAESPTASPGQAHRLVHSAGVATGEFGAAAASRAGVAAVGGQGASAACIGGVASVGPTGAAATGNAANASTVLVVEKREHQEETVTCRTAS